MSYRSNSIPNIRTIKALRGEALKIDLGKAFEGTLVAWMKRNPDDLVYRSFEVQDGRYLYLTKEKASDYIEEGVVVAAIEGKWYFDVEQEIVDEDTKTIYRGTIMFQNDITGSLGSEVPAPTRAYKTINIEVTDQATESLSGEATTQQEVNEEFKAAIEGGTGGGAIEEDIVSFGVGDVGGIADGDTLPEGSTLTDSFKQLLQKLIPVVPPTASISVTPISTQEIGATIDFTLTPSFTQNDGGVINQVVFKRNGTIIQTQADLTPFVDTNQVIQAGSNPYSVEISYDEGSADPQKDGVVPAGTAIGTNSVVGAYRNWYGAYGVLPPVDGDDIRTLGYSYNNSFTLATGTSALYHIVAVPSTRSLISVIDETALGVDLTADYVLSGTITEVDDGGGNPVSYKVYILAIAVAYSESHNHNIIVG